MKEQWAATPAERKQLRRLMRAARRGLGDSERKAAERSIISHIRSLPAYRRARRVGTFVAFDGEPDLAPLRKTDGRRQFCVPVVGTHSMRFAAAAPEAETIRNRFGIREPRRPRVVPSGFLDIVLTPLVAFDDNGIRVGVGRGYYDRCFARLRGRRRWRRPKLVGVAFECQRVRSIAASPWDVPLWGIITERGFRKFAQSE